MNLVTQNQRVSAYTFQQVQHDSRTLITLTFTLQLINLTWIH